MKYFFHLDIDADKKIDTKEFMAILEEDVSITDILNHDNPVLRGWFMFFGTSVRSRQE